MKPIRILHLEDSPRDAQLIHDKLESEGLAFDVVHVQDQEDFKNALATSRYDIVLCDYNLPGYDGISALQHTQKENHSVPVILISGSLNEDEAVECLKYGATDYLLKGRLERLAPAVRRALKEAREKEASREASRKLEESEERFRQLAEGSSEVFWFRTLNPDQIQYISPAVEKVWGLSAEEFYRDPGLWLSSIHPEDRCRVEQAHRKIVNGQLERLDEEYRIIHTDGNPRWVMNGGTAIRDHSGEIVRFGGVIRDITEHKNLQQQFLRAQRLESIGTLAGGIAHDLNNVLAPIVMGIDVIATTVTDPDNLELLATMAASARRGAELIEQVLSFARGVEGRKISLRPQHTIDEIARIVRDTFPKSIEIVVSISKRIWNIEGDPTQLHQVLLNLCVNARDAMPAGGRIQIRAENQTFDELEAHANLDSRPGDYVRITVEDTGTGIPGEIIEKIFDPFFTTKEVGKGTGLGLSTSLAIIRSHGGFMRANSEVGQGTHFDIYLPAATVAHPETNEGVSEPLWRGSGETILVVDDEAAIREMTERTLKAFGYKVLLAGDGREAITVYTQNQETIDVVLTDLMMPQMDGRSMIEIVRQFQPHVPVIATSGLGGDLDAANLVERDALHFLAKPYTARTLLTALSRVLRSTTNGP